MSRGPVLAVPACEPGRGGGHLIRCLSLVRDLRSLGREALLFLSPKAGNLDGFFKTRNFDSAWCIHAGGLGEKAWECIVLDRFQTPAAEFSRWAELAPLIGIDEGGPCRDRFDFLIDILPGLPLRSKPNIAGVSLLPLPGKPSVPVSAARSEKHPLKIMISFGQEDSAGLGPLAAEALASQNSGGLLDITLLTGGLNRPSGGSPARGVRVLDSIPKLGERLADYDLVITHYGLTAFESLYAAAPVLLLSPTAYHERLAKASGFCSAGIGKPGAARLSRLLFKNGGPKRFLHSLKTRCTNLAVRYHLEHDPKQSLAELINGFVPQVSRRCPVCGAAVIGLPYIGRGEDRSFRTCPRCGAITMNRLNPPPIEYAREYFFDFYRRQYGKTYIEDFPNLIAMGRRRLAVIKSLLSRSGKMLAKGPIPLLDIGCAYGPFLAAAKEEGFSPFGIDPTEDAVRYVTQTFHIPAVQGFFPPFPDPRREDTSETVSLPREFGVVTLWYVIEHFRDCVPALAEIRRILKPGGTLAFASPSFSGISGRVSIERFLEQSPADHWTIWSPAMCKKALKLAGFKVKKIVISGHHPERFPLFGKLVKNKKGPLYALLLAASTIFSLGDTFEVYAVAKETT